MVYGFPTLLKGIGSVFVTHSRGPAADRGYRSAATGHLMPRWASHSPFLLLGNDAFKIRFHIGHVLLYSTLAGKHVIFRSGKAVRHVGLYRIIASETDRCG